MQVNVQFLEPFDKFDEKIDISIKGDTVNDLILFLAKKYGDRFKKTIFKKNKLDEGIMLLVNGVSIMGDINTKLKNNSKVVLSRTISGG